MKMRQMILMMMTIVSTGCSMSYSYSIGYPKVHTHLCEDDHCITTDAVGSSVPPEWWKSPIGTTDQYYHCVSNLSWASARNVCLNNYAHLLGHKDHTGVQTVAYRRGAGGSWTHHFLVGKATTEG